MGIDDVGGRGLRAQGAHVLGSRWVEGPLVDALQEPCQKGLARTTTPPRLGHAARGCTDPLATAPCRLHQSCDLAIAPVKCDQRTRIEDEAHSRSTRAPSCPGPFERALRSGHFRLREAAVLLFPRADGILQRVKTKPVPGCLGKPGGDTLPGRRRRGSNGLSQLELERDAHLFDAHTASYRGSTYSGSNETAPPTARLLAFSDASRPPTAAANCV